MMQTSVRKKLLSFFSRTQPTEVSVGQAQRISRTLIGKSREEYGERYRDHLLEQYKKYLEMADKISDRRAAANTFFLTVNTGLISAFGIANVIVQRTSKFLLIAGGFAAILLSYSWYRLIRAYRDLSTAKFYVVHEMEKHLPVRPFDAEWEAVGRGKDRRFYWPFTHIERFVPWIFIFLYGGVIVWSFLSIRR